MNNKLDYIELICKISPNLQKHADILTAYLTDRGFESFMETEKGINAYIAECQFKQKDLKDFEKQFEFKKVELKDKPDLEAIQKSATFWIHS